MEFAESCGERGPIRLLELATDEMVAWDPHSVVSAEGRVLVGVVDRVDITSFHGGLDRGAAARRVVSIDECGGDIQTLAEAVDTSFVAPREGAPSFACAGGVSRLTWIDPSGDAPGKVVDAVDCRLAWVDDRVVYERADGESTALVSTRFDARGDVEESVVLVANLTEWQRRSVGDERDDVGDEPTGRVFALSDGQLLDIDVATGAVEVVAEDASMFSVRYPDLVVVGSERHLVLDLEAGTQIEFELPLDRVDGPPVFGPDTVALPISRAWGGTALVTLDEHYAQTVNGVWRPVWTTSMGKRLMTGADQWKRGLHSWLPGEHTELVEGLPVELRVEGPDLLVLTYTYGGHERAQEVARYKDPWLARPVLVQDAYRPQRLAGGGWVTVRAEVGEVAGDLLLVREDGATELIDTDVHLEVAAFSGPWGVPTEPVVTYVVEDGERRGLWRAHLDP